MKLCNVYTKEATGLLLIMCKISSGDEVNCVAGLHSCCYLSHLNSAGERQTVLIKRNRAVNHMHLVSVTQRQCCQLHLRAMYWRTEFTLSTLSNRNLLLSLDYRAIGVRFPAGEKDFSSNFCVQTGSGAHPASCTVGTGGPSPEQTAAGK
jgi:hypothetical protein